MKRNWKRIISNILTVCMLTTMVLGCSSNNGSDVEDSTKMKTVRFGLLPYQDWMPWMLADELGYFEEVGIDLEVINFTDDITCAEALQSGDIDIACGNSNSGPMALSKFPDLRVISCTCGFLGYAIMVRPADLVESGGEVKTYQNIYDEEIAKGTSEEEANDIAIEQACAQLKGKTMVMDRGTGSNLPLNAALKAGGLTVDDIEYMDISDVEGALAFLDGTGDFELGGYPQVTSLSENGCSKLISGVELGGEAVCLSVEMAKEDYVEENMDTILAMREVWYRVIDDIYSDDTTYMEKLAEVTSKYTGSEITVEAMRNIAENIDPWPSKDEAEAIFFADDAKWKVSDIYTASLNYWVNINGQVKDGSVDLQKQFDTLKKIHDEAVK